MEVLLVMPPGLEMWFGEWDWIDWYEDDEDWPEEGCLGAGYASSPFSFLVQWYPESDFLVAIA